jgi:hypothetical protein
MGVYETLFRFAEVDPDVVASGKPQVSYVSSST